ncbi:hypothetical protein VTK73DRAFT_49 [Phialemonium thermophilum]|uniref:DNA double-strand break repair and VJ recombination XRCC4 n=1 Tax=Phialemonium thermophilum TaxID=223376 RepID=A0ABR3Y8Q8_9PEZI
MSESHILRIPRSDEEGGYVLVQTTSSGPKVLDLKLVATEGFAPYVVKLRQDRISTLKAKNSPCSQDEWERFLASVLLERESVPDIEAAAHVAEEESITINIRRRVQGITQRLGTLSLKHDEGENIQLFEWCSTSIAARETLSTDLASAVVKTQRLENAVADLKTQIEELIQAKQSDEGELLEKFRDLLNEKKVKIREQQRLLAAAHVGPDPRASPQAKTVKDEARRSQVPQLSRQSKRKAAQAVEAEDNSDDSYDMMEVDKRHGEENSEERETPDPDETGSEPDDPEDEQQVDEGLEGERRHHGSGKRQDSPEPPSGPSGRTRHAQEAKQAAQEPPPKRSLPFGLGKTKSGPHREYPVEEEGSESEDDDEL